MKDLRLDDAGDIAIGNGDFELVDSLEQDVRMILTAIPGHVRSDVVIGADVESMINAENPAEIQSKIAAHLKRDGIRLISMKWDGTKMKMEVEQ